jgi:hypothetical protein
MFAMPRWAHDGVSAVRAVRHRGGAMLADFLCGGLAAGGIVIEFPATPAENAIQADSAKFHTDRGKRRLFAN